VSKSSTAEIISFGDSAAIRVGREILAAAEARGLSSYEGIPELRDALSPPVASGDTLWEALADGAEALLEWAETEVDDWEEGLTDWGPYQGSLIEVEDLAARVARILREYDDTP